MDERSTGIEHEIPITSAQVELLAEGFARTWQRPPSSEDMVGLVDDFVRDEIYYREAIAMGLDRDDTIMRRRMRQKLEFFTDDVIAAVEPSDEELSTYLAENQTKFLVAQVANWSPHPPSGCQGAQQY